MALEVLVVDDEADIRELVSGVLEDEGFAVRAAADSNAALGIHPGGPRVGEGNVEVRYSGPDNVNFDVSQTGWVGTPTTKAGGQ